MAPNAPIEPEAIYGSTLLDGSGQPNIVIDSSQVHELIWTLINNQDKELVVTPFPPGNVGEDRYHFKFDFTPGAITSLVTMQGWEIFSVKVDKGIKTLYVALSGAKPISLKPRSSEQTAWFYTRAIQEDSNNSKISVHLTAGNNVTVGGSPILGKIIGLDDLKLVHENAPALSAPPLAIDFVGRRTVLNDGQTTNSFTFALTNMMQAELTLKPNSTILTAWFDAAPNDTAHGGYPWALAKLNQLTSTDFDLAKPSGDWSIKKNVSAPDHGEVVSPRWTITVSNPVVLKPQDPVLFTFKGLRTDLDPGVARMYLRIENVSDFRPAVLIAGLEKTPLLYGARQGQGLYFSAGEPGDKTPPAPNYESGLYVQQFGKGAAAIFNGGRVGIGTGANAPAAKLQIFDDDQNPADAGTLILGPGNLSQGVTLRLGCQSGYSWIQSQGNKPLAINPVGNNVGIGTADPGSSLSVAGGMAIGKTYAQKNTATISANTVAVEGKVGIGTLAPSAMLQVGDTTLKPKIFDDLTTVGILQPAGHTVGLSIRRFEDHAQLQFCVYDKAGTPFCNYIKGEKGTGDILIGPSGELRVTAKGKVSTPNLAAATLSAGNLALTGNLTITSDKKVKNVLELGFGYPNKQQDAGKIGFKLFSDGLDIVGVGDAKSRVVHVWENLALNSSGDQDIKTVLELGYGYPGKQKDAGKIGYKAFSDGLDIVGATFGDNKRAIVLWDEVYVRGNLWMPSGNFWSRLAPQNPVESGSWQWAQLVSSSDHRLKKNVTPIESPLDKVRKLRGCTYHWNEEALTHFTKRIDTLQPVKPMAPEELEELKGRERAKQQEILKKTQVGVIAQEVEAVLPQAVTTEEDGYKSVNYQQLIALLIEAVNEQDRVVAAQAAEIKQLKTKLN